MTSSSAEATATRSAGWANALATLAGLGLTAAFYALLPFLPFYQAEAQRYFCAHWIEYATTALFGIGIAALVVKAARIPAERAILTVEPLHGLSPGRHETALQTVERIVNQVHLVARRARRTQLVRRILDVCDYVRSRRSADSLDGQLSYLAELASGRLHQSYALIRTITWAIPILGFLGTVIGITMAIANITPEQLESSLPEVTSGLAVAFDTTALSLGLSMVLVFLTFVVERQEQNVLDDIEDFARQALVALFPAPEAAAGPLLQAESQAAAQLLQRTEMLVSWQMQEWQTALENLRERWTTTLQQQQEHLDQALQSGLAQTLADHTRQLDVVRSDFLSAFERAAASLTSQTEAICSALGRQQQAGIEALNSTWQHYQDDLQAARLADRELSREVFSSFAEHISQWQDRLQSATEAVTRQLDELRGQGATLLRIVEQEEQLVRLEERLTQNLDAVRVVDSLEETLLNLNAAVHLLSTKTRAKAA